MQLLGSHSCGSTVILPSVFLGTAGRAALLKKIGARDSAITPRGITKPLPFIADDIVLKASDFLGLEAKGAGLGPRKGSADRFEDPSSCIIVPYVFVEIGTNATLTFQNYNQNTGKAGMPPGFGLHLRRENNAWIPVSQINSSNDAPGILSTLGWALSSEMDNPPIPDNISQLEGDAFVILDEKEHAVTPSSSKIQVAINGAVIFPKQNLAQSCSGALVIASGDPTLAPGLAQWLRLAADLLAKAERSEALPWVERSPFGPSPKVEESKKEWASLSLAPSVFGSGVFARALLPSQPISVVYFVSATDSAAQHLYMLNDDAGRPMALIPPPSAKLQSKIALFELASVEPFCPPKLATKE